MIVNKIKYNDEISYLEYTTSKSAYDNATFYIIDLNNEELRNFLENVGGFCTNVLRKRIELNNLKNVSKVLLASVPRQFSFKILYLDDSYNVLDILIGDDYTELKYFVNKCRMAIERTGLIYELDESILNKLDFCKDPSDTFLLKVEGREVDVSDILITRDIENIEVNVNIKNNIRKFNATSVLFYFDYDEMTDDIAVNVTILDTKGQKLLNHQIKDGIADLKDYLEDNGSMDPYYLEEYCSTIRLKDLKSICETCKVEYYNGSN